MAKVVDINSKKRPPKKDTVLLWQMSKDIDNIIVDAIANKNLNPSEVAAILSHRLGSLITACEEPDAIYDFCAKVLKRAIDEHNKAS